MHACYTWWVLNGKLDSCSEFEPSHKQTSLFTKKYFKEREKEECLSSESPSDSSSEEESNSNETSNAIN